MNWKTVEKVVQNTDKQWYITLNEVAKIIGCCRQTAAEFLLDNAVTSYKIGKSKSYFVPDLLEAIEKNKWRQ